MRRILIYLAERLTRDPALRARLQAALSPLEEVAETEAADVVVPQTPISTTPAGGRPGSCRAAPKRWGVATAGARER